MREPLAEGDGALLLRCAAAGMTPNWWPRQIIAPANEAEREAVRVAQRALRVSSTGDMDDATKAALRGIQRLYGAPATGILDEATAVIIDGLRPYQVVAEEKPCRPY